MDDRPPHGPSAAKPGTVSVSIPFGEAPQGLYDPDPDTVVMRDDYETHITDLAAARAALGQLRLLMRNAHEGGMGAQTHLLGMSVLLEGMHGRLDMALDGLVMAGRKLGFDTVQDLPGVRD